MYIVVVEDDPDAREILRMLLDFCGAQVTTVPSESEALSILTATDPTVVVADLMLDPGNGLRLLRHARKRGITAPFIAVSATDFAPDALESMGFAAYLRKPLDHDGLVDTILAVVRER